MRYCYYDCYVCESLAKDSQTKKENNFCTEAIKIMSACGHLEATIYFIVNIMMT